MNNEQLPEQRRILMWLGVLFVALSIFFYVISKANFIPCGFNSEVYKWLDLALGISWNNKGEDNAFWLSTALSFRTLLTIGPAIGIFWMTIQIFGNLVERKNTMKLADAFANRDAEIKMTIKFNLLKFVSPDKKEEYLKDIEKELQDAFNISDEEFKERLDILYGKDRSRAIIDHINADIK